MKNDKSLYFLIILIKIGIVKINNGRMIIHEKIIIAHNMNTIILVVSLDFLIILLSRYPFLFSSFLI